MNSGDFKIATIYADKTGNISKSISSGSFYGANYGTGHLSTRICDMTNSRITVIGKSHLSAGWNQTVYAYLQYSISGGTWVTISTGSVGMNDIAFNGTIISSTVSLPGLISAGIMTELDSITFRVSGGTSTQWVATLNNQ